MTHGRGKWRAVDKAHQMANWSINYTWVWAPARSKPATRQLNSENRLDLLQLLSKHRMINKYQQQKIINDYIAWWHTTFDWLKSRKAEKKNNNNNQASHDFTVHFLSPIRLDSQKKYKAALNKLITMTYSWYNIAEAYRNNKLKWRKKTWRLADFDFPGWYVWLRRHQAFFADSDGLEWHLVNKSQIDSVRIRVTDGRNNILDLNGIDGALSIVIEVE